MAAKVEVEGRSDLCDSRDMKAGEFLLTADGTVWMRTHDRIIEMCSGLSWESTVHKVGRRLTKGERIIITVE